MGFDVLSAAIAGGVAGALSAVLYLALSLRNSLASERESMRALLERARLDLANANDQLEHWTERGVRERQRVEQRERRTKPADAPPPAFVDARSYQRHLERGGARDLAFETQLGWNHG